VVGLGQQHEEVLRADVHAVSAGRARLREDHRQVLLVHADRVEAAHPLAVAETQAAPATGQRAAVHHHRRAAGAGATIVAEAPRVEAAAGALEPRDPPLLAPHVHSEEGGDLRQAVGARHGAAPGLDVAPHQPAGEGRTARLTAGPAVVARQQLLHHLEPRVLLDAKEAVGQRQHRREEEAEPRHHDDGDRDLSHGCASLRR
jgi:hypothetical protein